MIKYLFNKNNSKSRLLRCIFLLKEFDLEIKDKEETEQLQPWTLHKYHGTLIL